MNQFELDLINSLFKWEGNVSNLSQDRGGWTYKGLSSRVYPWIRDAYENSDDIDQLVRETYYRDYMLTIHDWKRLQVDFPWLAVLMFAGKVHGSGDEHLTEVIQNWLFKRGSNLRVDGLYGPRTSRSLFMLSGMERMLLRDYVFESKSDLANRRVRSVGAYSDGIRNRLDKVYAYAFTPDHTPVQNSPMSVAGVSSAVVAHAKLSSVLAAPDGVGLQVVSSDGWEQLPLGMDITIEIRGVDNASDPIHRQEVS